MPHGEAEAQPITCVLEHCALSMYYIKYIYIIYSLSIYVYMSLPLSLEMIQIYFLRLAGTNRIYLFNFLRMWDAPLKTLNRLGRKLPLTPSQPHCGNCGDPSQRLRSLCLDCQALSLPLLQREATRARERHLSDFLQSVTQNGHVYLLLLERHKFQGVVLSPAFS